MATKCNDSKRRDHKGRILKTGESQRTDLIYQYRYTDIRGKRHCIYTSDLKALREEEKRIHVQLTMGIDYTGGSITVWELCKRDTDLKRTGVKRSTQLTFDKTLRQLDNSDIGHKMIRDLKMSEVKQWFVELTMRGLSRSTLKQIRGIMRPAYEMALQEDVVHKKTFNFTIDFVPDNSKAREALTRDQQQKLLEFARTDPKSMHHYDLIVVLLGTGMRAGELCGLTFDDLDFENRRIFVRRQLMRHPNGGRYIETPKSKHSNRVIPMSDEGKPPALH